MRKAIAKCMTCFIFGIVAILLIASTAMTYFSIQRLNEGIASAIETNRVLFRLESAISSLKDEIRGGHGFLLTGDARYLTASEIAIRSLDADLAQVRALARDPRQRVFVAAMEKPIDQLIRMSMERPSSDRVPAMLAQENVLLEQLARAVDQFENAEAVESRRQQEAIRKHAMHTMWASGFCSLLTLGLLLF